MAFYRQNPGCLLVLEKPLYHYMIARQGSLSNRYHPERLEDNFYLSDAVWDTVAAWGLQNSPMHRAKANYCTVRDLMMGVKNLGCSPLSLAEQTAWLRSALQKPRVHTAVRSTRCTSCRAGTTGSSCCCSSCGCAARCCCSRAQISASILKRNAKIPRCRLAAGLLPI